MCHCAVKTHQLHSFITVTLDLFSYGAAVF